jgi:hypothetical protein
VTDWDTPRQLVTLDQWLFSELFRWHVCCISLFLLQRARAAAVPSTTARAVMAAMRVQPPVVVSAGVAALEPSARAGSEPAGRAAARLARAWAVAGRAAAKLAAVGETLEWAAPLAPATAAQRVQGAWGQAVPRAPVAPEAQRAWAAQPVAAARPEQAAPAEEPAGL